MPLLRAMARTAVVAGTATAVSNRVSRRQANRWAGEEQPQDGGAQDAPPAEPQPDKLTTLKELGELRDSGVLTEAEFQVQKEKVLAG